MVRKRNPERGFTLIELIIVMTIILLLMAMAIPAYQNAVKKAKEAVLKEDLQTMRQAIDSYTVDKEKGPQTLEDLVQAGYLKAMPTDPFTHRSDTWQTSSDGTYSSVDQTDTGIQDVHSGSQEIGTDGSMYSTW
ncbi:MAG: prepilin-type N-terminal cleavage/methylation domain-containing protein [Acidobacteria bacterium]|jgi:general secretion pathway protein G|nr:prepilin-type N-terminal cleavage/methylation domain-containing protein [Acidobacteriota bacterium]